MMNHPPNVDAACFFAREIFPLVRSEIPEAEFWIVGRDPTEEIQALAQLPGIVVTGVVPDIRPYIREATVFVVPLRFGSGMRQKILEAWGMQKCVIATSLGAEGIDYRDGENILIADDAPTLAATVIQAIRDPELRERIRMEGRKRIFQQHHPGILAKKYHDGIASILREKKKKEASFHALIDLRWMHPQFAGGIENLSRSFLNHLLHLDSFNQYLVLLPPETRYDFDMRHRPNFRIRMGESQKYDWRSLVRRACQGVLHRLRIPPWQPPELRTLRRVRSFKTEIALSIPGYISPDLYPLLNVLVVPDVQHEFYPEFFLPQHLEERKRVYTDSIRRADHICTISEFTRRTLIERLGISPEKVTTTHLAADPLFHPQDSSHGNHSQILKKYGLKPGEYLLFPGNTWPHKNHRTALRALHLLRETHHFDPVLVCTGAFKEAHGELNQIIQDLRLQKQVKFLGYLPAGDMPTLYKGAAALFFPSLFEGFGIPLLEAMWCDCPVICSRTTSLPEIAGEAALLVDPLSPEEQAEAISQILNRKDLRISLVERGRRQARKFSWSRFTTTVVRILYEVRESHRG
jgi:glycosyltransferase involved in cell wall biosynthesis